jgi:hypothetical protein
MEGPLLCIKVWALSALFIWVYRRYFERVAAPCPEFEALCHARPALLALRCDVAEVALVARALRERFGPTQQVIATLGGWPWPNYKLTVSLEITHDALLLVRVVAAKLLRTREPSLPALVTATRDVITDCPTAVTDVWVDARVICDVLDKHPRLAGWRILAGREPRPQVQAYADAPDWLEVT